MVTCIQLDMECAAICYATGQVMSIGGKSVKELCGTCAEICNTCGDECAKHNMDHCKRCAEACLQCSAECRKMSGERN
ncbi:MAG: four-helix bundle copper-binding protein [Bacteroidota bacterium]